MRSIKYDRLYCGPDGKSRVQRGLEIALTTRDFVPPAPPIEVSRLEPASTYAFLVVPASFVGDWHPSPKRQWVFYLQGEMEYEAGDGSKWRVGPGSYMLTEDTTGEGHRSRVVGHIDALLVTIQLDP
ncbi:MAG: cupin domain-containing protein [Gammaproteobacteria bacterium]|nr:cupin domain-containing protein [Gammaproteobacteria bacterium]